MKYSSSCTIKLLCLLALLFVCPCADAKTLHVVHLCGYNKTMKNDMGLVRQMLHQSPAELGGYDFAHYPIYFDDYENAPESLYRKLGNIVSNAAPEEVVWCWVSAHGNYVRTNTETVNRTDFYFISRYDCHRYDAYRLQSLLDDNNCRAHLKIFSHDTCYVKLEGEQLESPEYVSLSEEDPSLSDKAFFRGMSGKTSVLIGTAKQQMYYSPSRLAANLRYLLASNGYYQVSAVRRGEAAGGAQYGMFTFDLLKYLNEKNCIQSVPAKERMYAFWDGFSEYYNDLDQGGRHLQYSDMGPIEIPTYIRYTNIYNGRSEIRKYVKKGVVVAWVFDAAPNCPASLMKLKKGDVIEAFRLGDNVYWVNNKQDTHKVIPQFKYYTTVTVRVLRKKWDPEYGKMAYFQEEIKDVPLGRQSSDLLFGGTLLGYNELFE